MENDFLDHPGSQDSHVITGIIGFSGLHYLTFTQR